MLWFDGLDLIFQPEFRQLEAIRAEGIRLDHLAFFRSSTMALTTSIAHAASADVGDHGLIGGGQRCRGADVGALAPRLDFDIAGEDVRGGWLAQPEG